MISDKAWLALEQKLPSGALRRDKDVLGDYARDESEAAPTPPEGVVFAKSTHEVSSVMQWASAHRVAVTPRAGGTGRSGGAIPAEGGIVLTFEKMDAIKEIIAEDQLAVVEPGVVLADLHRTVEAAGLFYPPDPNSLDSCCLGGNIAENAGGPRAFKYGVTRDYVYAMEVVTAQGEILRLGRKTIKGVTGYDLCALMVGSEGTLAIVTEATLRIKAKPREVRTFMALLDSESAAQLAMKTLLAAGVVPRCAELLDASALRVVRQQIPVPVNDQARALILFEVDGEESQANAELERSGNVLDGMGALEVVVASNGKERDSLWAARRNLSFTMRKQARHKLSEDIVVPRSRIAELLLWLPQLPVHKDIRTVTYGHVGDGNLHVNLLWDDDALWPMIEKTKAKLFEKVIGMEGTLTGEHGVGLTKAAYLHLEQSRPLITLQQKLKTMFDPQNILNPGKMFVTASHRAC